MSNGRKLPASGSNQSQPKIFPPGTGSSDSSSALTVENVKKLEKAYTTSKEAFNKRRIRDYIKQTNLALFSKKMTRKQAQSLSGMQILKEPPHPFLRSRAKRAKMFAGRPLKKFQGKISY